MTVVEFRKPKVTQNQRSYNREARRLAASKPRRSKNGTPEQRAAKKTSAAIVAIAPQRADRIVPSVVRLLRKDDAAAKSSAPRDTLAARREAMSAFVEQMEPSDSGPSAA
jgi:hypothetical protein